MAQPSRILVVEDEGIIALELAEHLAHFGHEVVGTAANGARAVELAAATAPDLVMMDVVIKGPEDGIATAERIRAARDVPVIFLTAYADRETVERAKRAAPYGYLLKPYRPDELRAAIEVALVKHQLERRARESEARFSSAFDHAAVGMALVAPDGRLTLANRALRDLLGFSEPELLDMTLPGLLFPEAVPAEPLSLSALAEAGVAALRLERRMVTRSGLPKWTQINLSAVRDEAQRPLYYLAQVEDISARREAEEKLHELAHYDPLTGLPNRAALQECLDGKLAAARRHGHALAMMFLDLDGFKHVNDSMGHRAGDDLLRQVAGRLKAVVRADDCLARLGGDEFVVILGDVSRSELAGVVANKLSAAIAAPYTVEGREVVVTTSIGISLYPQDGETAARLLRNADSAMYHAKDQGKNQFAFYRSELTDRAVERLALESALRVALARRELLTYYQPIMADGRPEGVEALLRWNHPERGVLLPDAFIGLAEETGLLNGLGAWVLRSACADWRRWQDKGLEPGYVAVNVSYRQLLDAGFQPMVEAALRDSGLPADRLSLELTESTIMRDVGRTVQALQALRDLGVGIRIDDFGAGHSSLALLTRLPVRGLKIDRGFVRDLPDSRDAAAVIGAILAMGRALSLEIVAEGVETAEQEQFLLAREVRRLQGYRYARPMPAAETTAFLRATGRGTGPGTTAWQDSNLAPRTHSPAAGR